MVVQELQGIYLILFVLLGAVVGMIYGLRRIFILEYKIEQLEEKINILIGKRRR